VKAFILSMILFVSIAVWITPDPASPAQVGPPLRNHGVPVYHDHPPAAPVAETLDPGQFKENRAAFVVYTLAARIKETLYQVPCYCPCNKHLGHESLLDCYTSTHGVGCQTCQREVLFCFLKRKKDPTWLREQIAKGAASKLDLAKSIDRFYQQLEHADP
jgi:hypothetical protein